MSINYNGKTLKRLALSMEPAARALFYGDGLFETIRMYKGQLPFLDLHWMRLERGLRILGFEIPDYWSVAYFEKEIQRIASGNARIRLSVWRSPGGYFYPTDNRTQFLITSSALDSDWFPWQNTGLSVRLSERVKLPVDTLSGLKTLSGIRYVVAAMEAREKEVDDVIVLNERGHVCETTNSNLLWIKDGRVFCVPAADGQVTGTMQKILSGILQQEGIEIEEKACTFAGLMDADELLLTNAVQGIRWVRFLEGKELACQNIIYFNKLMVRHLEGILG